MNPILFNFPEEILTERLLIRMPRPGDGEAVHQAIQASLDDLKPWMPWAHANQSIEDVELNVRKAHVQFLAREDLRLHIFHKETGMFIASSGLHRINWNLPKFEIGYWIDSRYSGKGYMTEAVEAIAHFAFNELSARRVEIRCDPENRRSRKVAERIGFSLEAILKKEMLSADGKEPRNTCIYAKIK